MMTEEQLKKLELADLAKKLKSAYGVQMQIRSNKEYRPSPRFDTKTVWMNNAKLCMKLGADPEDFVAAQFKFRNGATVFANTLGGPAAEKAYRSFQYSTMQRSTGEDLAINLDPNMRHSPGEVELAQRFATLEKMLQFKTGSVSVCSAEAIEAILATPWLFDPLMVMLTSGNDPRIKEEFNQAALDDLYENPYLRRAIKALNLHIEYLDETD